MLLELWAKKSVQLNWFRLAVVVVALMAYVMPTNEREWTPIGRGMFISSFKWMFEFQAVCLTAKGIHENKPHWTREFISAKRLFCWHSVNPNQLELWSYFWNMLNILTIENEPIHWRHEIESSFWGVFEFLLECLMHSTIISFDSRRKLDYIEYDGCRKSYI